MKFISFFDPKKEIDFIGKFGFTSIIGIIIPTVSLLALVFWGISWGIDFSGGMEMQVKFSKSVSAKQIRNVLDDLGYEKNQVQSYGPVANHEMLVRVERMSMLQTSDVAKITNILAKITNKPNLIKIKYNEKLGDRIDVQMPIPAKSLSNPKTEKEFKALSNDLDKQEMRILASLESNGYNLRKTKGIEDNKLSTKDAIVREDPINGIVNYTIQFAGISEEIAKSLSATFGNVEVRRVEFVDSQVSKQLRTDGLLAVLFAIAAIIIYIAVRFEISFSPGAIVSLVHDTLGAMLVYVLFRVEFDLPSIAALLTIVGYSINNTIVVYDRIREALASNNVDNQPNKLKALVNKAVNDTLSRTINTSLTTLFASVSLAIFAGGVVQSFALVLSLGIILGAFSSTFIAPATYLFLKLNFATAEKTQTSQYSREDRKQGIV